MRQRLHSGVAKRVSTFITALVLAVTGMSGATPLFLSQKAFADTATQVTPIDYQDWQVYKSTGELSFTDDALELSTPSGYVQIYRDAATPVAVNDINVSYQTKRLSGATHAAPSYVLGIDKDGNTADTSDEMYAWFEPVYNSGSNYNSWNTWTLNQTAKFWSMSTVGTKGGANGANLFTLADVHSEFSNAKVIDYTINMGSGNDGWSALVDNVVTPETTYDFGAPTPSETYVNYPNDSTHVDGYNNFSTIQSAINAVENNGTVHLAAGNYNENVNVNKPVTLAGKGSDKTIISGTTGVGLSLSAGTDASHRVIVKNLKVTGFTTGVVASSFNTLRNVVSENNTNYGMSLNSLNDLRIFNSKFNNNTVGLKLGSTASANKVQISGSEFNGNTQHGWYSDKNAASGSYLTHLTVTDTSFSSNGTKGFYTEKLSDATFDGIVVDNSGSTGSFGSGFNINLKYGDYQNITLSNFEVTHSGLGDTTNGTGINIEARDDGPYASNPASLTNVTISDGKVTGNQTGIRFGETGKNNAGPNNVTLSGVDLSGNVNGAVNNQTTANVNAAYNWWGQMNGPAAGQVTGDVTTAPWCKAADCSSFFSNKFVQLPTSDGHATTSSDGPLTLSGSTPLGNVSVFIPKSTTFTADSSWDGVVNAPQYLPNFTIPVPHATNVTAVSVGSDSHSLLMNNLSRLSFANVLAKYVGYLEPETGSHFTDITTTCGSDSQAWAEANLGSYDACKTTDGSGNLVVWTNHFTTFAAYNVATTSNSDDKDSSTGNDLGAPTPTYTPSTVATVSSASASDNSTNEDTGRVLGNESQTGTASATTTNNAKNDASKGCGKVLGLCWYVWIPIVLVVAYVLYRFFRPNRGNTTISGR